MLLSLGLTSDDQNLHDERIKLWNDFNHAWLAMFQRQKEMMESGQQLQRGQSLVPQDGLQKMGKDLVRLCDSIERHGLVDYQYGVWEEQIIASRLRSSFTFGSHYLLTMPYTSFGRMPRPLRVVQLIGWWWRGFLQQPSPLKHLTYV